MDRYLTYPWFYDGIRGHTASSRQTPHGRNRASEDWKGPKHPFSCLPSELDHCKPSRLGVGLGSFFQSPSERGRHDLPRI